MNFIINFVVFFFKFFVNFLIQFFYWLGFFSINIFVCIVFVFVKFFFFFIVSWFYLYNYETFNNGSNFINFSVPYFQFRFKAPIIENTYYVAFNDYFEIKNLNAINNFRISNFVMYKYSPRIRFSIVKNGGSRFLWGLNE